MKDKCLGYKERKENKEYKEEYGDKDSEIAREIRGMNDSNRIDEIWRLLDNE